MRMIKEEINLLKSPNSLRKILMPLKVLEALRKLYYKIRGMIKGV